MSVTLTNAQPSNKAVSATQTSSRVMVLDEKNMLKLWLEEKIVRHELTPAQADEMLANAEG